jgi:hypothetical protein
MICTKCAEDYEYSTEDGFCIRTCEYDKFQTTVDAMDPKNIFAKIKIPYSVSQ